MQPFFASAANIGKVTFLGGSPALSAQRHEILSQNTKDFRLSHGENVGSKRYWDVTPGQTDEQNCRS